MSVLTFEQRVAEVEKAMESHADFPKPGILFWDLFPVMRHPKLFEDLITLLVEHIQSTHREVDVIVGLDARGFIFGPLIAQRLGISFAPIRKAGKLPGETIQATYTLEYGSDKFEAQKSSVKPGQKVVIVDDLLATGGTMAAASQLISDLEADILECLVVVELTDLNGRSKLKHSVFSLIKKQG